MKTIESKINSIVDKILKEEMSTKVNSAVKRVNEKLEDNEDYTTKKTKTSKDEVDESMTIKPKGMGMNLKKKSFDLSEMEDDEMKEASQKIYDELVGLGFEVLWDDRNERPGVKFKDADLWGIPVRVAIGGNALKAGKLEWKLRTEKGFELIDMEELGLKLQESCYNFDH